MDFGPVPVAQAAGAVLAHGVPQAGLSKGRVLVAADVAALLAAGVADVIVARLGPDDVAEDAAASALAAALVRDPAAQRVRAGAAATGRVNLYATAAGVLRLDASGLGALNAVDPMITLATLPDYARVGDGAMLATIKIIAYGVSRTSLEAACAAAARAGPATVFTVARPRVTLIETVHAGQTALPKGRAALSARLDRLGAHLHEVLEVPHATAAIAGALGAARGDLVCILTASATSDAGDVAPAGLVAAGGRLDHYGMPVDPGNLLFIGQHAARPVIGLPGCARSPALNGADWVLERLVCGMPVTGADIMAMGVGGLLKDIPSRPRPRTGPARG